MARVDQRYRCYFLDSTGSIHSSSTLAASNESDAIEAALRLWGERRHCRGVELWQGGKRLFLDVRSPSSEPRISRRASGS